MNEKQEHLAFNHQIGVALAEWQNIESGLYNLAQASSGDKPTDDAYVTLFTVRNFRIRLTEVDDLVSTYLPNTPHRKYWLSVQYRIATAARGRNALAHQWVLINPNGAPGHRWCLLPHLGILPQGSPQIPPAGSLCVRDISKLAQRFNSIGCALTNLAARVRGRPEPLPKHMERPSPPLTLPELTHEIRVLAGCPEIGSGELIAGTVPDKLERVKGIEPSS